MKEVSIKLYDSLEDEFKKYMTKFPNDRFMKFKSVGFYIQLPFTFSSKEIEELHQIYSNLFVKIINKLIELRKITNINMIGIIPLAQTSPSVRTAFLCSCNEYESNSEFEGFIEGEIPKRKTMEEISLFLKTLEDGAQKE